MPTTLDRPAPCDEPPTAAPSTPVIKHERHHHVHLILPDAAPVAADVLLFDPRTLNVSQRFGGPGEALLYRIIETRRRCDANLGHFGN